MYTYVDVWQKTAKFCRAIILQLKKKRNDSQPVEKQGVIVLSIKYFLYGAYLESFLYLSSLASEPRI